MWHVSKALALDTTNSGINLLAGMAYHIQAVKGDESRFDLAREGYKLAIKFDPSNWIAQYQLGLLHMDQRNYVLAQGRFAEALLFKPDDSNKEFYGIMRNHFDNFKNRADELDKFIADHEK